jgi:hypothetical protein
METKEAIAAVIKEDGIDGAIAWIAGVVDEKHKRIEALEKALRSIAANTCCDKCQEAALVARAALERKDEPPAKV